MLRGDDVTAHHRPLKVQKISLLRTLVAETFRIGRLRRWLSARETFTESDESGETIEGTFLEVMGGIV